MSVVILSARCHSDKNPKPLSFKASQVYKLQQVGQNPQVMQRY
jgi:hypothetical protein